MPEICPEFELMGSDCEGEIVYEVELLLDILVQWAVSDLGIGVKRSG
jgi:hypothetical protein